MKKILLALVLFALVILLIVFGGYKFIEYKAKSGVSEAKQKASEAVDRSARQTILVGLEIYYDEKKTVPQDISVLVEKKLIDPTFVNKVNYEYVDSKTAHICLKFDPKEYGEKQCVDFNGK